VTHHSFYVDPALAAAPQAEVAQSVGAFRSVVQDEDYRCAEIIQQNAKAFGSATVLFGRNEPALHHYHRTYRNVLGLPDLEVVSEA
jgi:hypothetical protein